VHDAHVMKSFQAANYLNEDFPDFLLGKLTLMLLVVADLLE